MARSVNWSIFGTVWVTSTATRDQVVPPLQVWATLALVLVKDVSKSVQDTYTQSLNGLVALVSTSAHSLSVRPPSNDVNATFAALHVMPLSVEVWNTMSPVLKPQSMPMM